MCEGKAEPLLTTKSSDRTRSGSTALQASAALCKGIVGTGVFALPPAIRASGWVLGTVLSLLCGFVSLLTMHYVMACIRELRRRGYADDDDGRIEYNDIFAHSQLLSTRANGLVTLLCVCGQLGSVLSFYAFVISNVLSLLPAAVARWHISVAMTLFTGPLVLLRSTSHPAFGAAMAFGNLAVAAALGVVVYGGLTGHVHGGARGELVGFDGGGVGIIFGVSLLMFSAHMEMVSIEQDMARREQFDQVLYITFGCVVLLFLGFGLLVYACFGEATGREHTAHGWEDVTILQNLNAHLTVTAVKLAMSANLTFMTPITMLPASKAVEDALGLASVAHVNVVRLALICGCALVATLLPNFEVISAVTGTSGGVTALVMPALCYRHFCCADPAGPSSRRRGGAKAQAALLVAAFGTVGFFYSLGNLVWTAV